MTNKMKQKTIVPKMPPIEQMPREELIAELQAWRLKYNAVVDEIRKKMMGSVNEQVFDSRKEIYDMAICFIREVETEIEILAERLIKNYDNFFSKDKSLIFFRGAQIRIPDNVFYYYNKLKTELDDLRNKGGKK